MSSTAIVITDELPETDASNCVYPPEYEGHLDRLMIRQDALLARIQELAQSIARDYQGQRPVLLCVLKGANPFYQHLLDYLMTLKQGFYTEFLRVSSYEGTNSSGQISIEGGLRMEELQNRHVVVIEDIVDTGTTLSQLLPLLKEQIPTIKSMEICTLLSKRIGRPAKCNAKYVGFSIPNHFIIGYGLDYNELYRDLKDIWVISQTGIDFDVQQLHA